MLESILEIFGFAKIDFGNISFDETPELDSTNYLADITGSFIADNTGSRLSVDL